MGNNFFLKNKEKKNFSNAFTQYLNNIWAYRYYKKYLNQLNSGNNSKNINLYLLSLKKKKFNKISSSFFKDNTVLSGNILKKNLFYEKNKYIKMLKNKVNKNFSIYFLNFFIKNKVNFFTNKYDINFYNRQSVNKNYINLNNDFYSGKFVINFIKNYGKKPMNSFYISMKQKRLELSAKGKFIFYNNFSKNNNLILPFSKINKSNSNLIANRLLSTNFTLVLPSSVVICAITNSFDVVHS